jgi:hypothetical protein
MSPDRNVASGAALAGIVLVVLPLLDLLVGGRAAAPVHATVAGFGLVLLAIAVARSAGKEER